MFVVSSWSPPHRPLLFQASCLFFDPLPFTNGASSWCLDTALYLVKMEKNSKILLFRIHVYEILSACGNMTDANVCAGAQVTIGYLVPMVLLYLWEMRERYHFAKARNLAVGNLQTCLATVSPAVLQEMLAIVLTAVILMTGP
jgi:hypothetical protein